MRGGSERKPTLKAGKIKKKPVRTRGSSGFGFSGYPVM
ncbi:hypothetical protein HMPREF9413_0373 [Paenibacillus sp. HGF7]|nr:hypothetical protein HMPREF9413_0373 [Paenibacillus sp. HGF7]